MCNLYHLKLSEDGFVVLDSAARKSVGKVEGGALVRDEIAHLVRLPRVLHRLETLFVSALQLLPYSVTDITALCKNVIEHDIGLDDGLSPLARRITLEKRLDVFPAGMHTALCIW